MDEILSFREEQVRTQTNIPCNQKFIVREVHQEAKMRMAVIALLAIRHSDEREHKWSFKVNRRKRDHLK